MSLSKMPFFKKRKKRENTYEENLNMLFGDEVKEAGKEILSEEQYVSTADQRRQYVENCCEQILSCSKHIEDAKAEYKKVGEYLSDVQTIETLPEDIKKDLIYYAKRIVVLENEKTGYTGSSSEIPEKSLIAIKNKGNGMTDVIKVMAKDEEFCENAKTDLTNLEGEKLALKYERADLIKYINTMRSVIRIGFPILLAIIGIMIYYDFTKNRNLSTAIILISLAGAGIVTAIFAINGNLAARLKATELKLNRLIGVENKIKLRYVNVRVKLDYEYNEYDVSDAYGLSVRYKKYLKAKKEQEIFEKTAETLYKSIGMYTDILRKLNLNDYSIWTSQPAAVINPKEMVEIKHMFNERRQNLRDTIEYNTELIEKAKEKVKTLTLNNKEYSDEILDIISKYEYLA